MYTSTMFGSLFSGQRVYRPGTMLSLEKMTSAPSVAHPWSGRPPAALRRWLPVAGPGLVMFTLGLLGCTRSVLSWDEIATADAAHRSVGQIWNLAQHRRRLQPVLPGYARMDLAVRRLGPEPAPSVDPGDVRRRGADR